LAKISQKCRCGWSTARALLENLQRFSKPRAWIWGLFAAGKKRREKDRKERKKGREGREEGYGMERMRKKRRTAWVVKGMERSEGNGGLPRLATSSQNPRFATEHRFVIVSLYFCCHV